MFMYIGRNSISNNPEPGYQMPISRKQLKALRLESCIE